MGNSIPDRTRLGQPASSACLQQFKFPLRCICRCLPASRLRSPFRARALVCCAHSPVGTRHLAAARQFEGVLTDSHPELLLAIPCGSDHASDVLVEFQHLARLGRFRAVARDFVSTAVPPRSQKLSEAEIVCVSGGMCFGRSYCYDKSQWSLLLGKCIDSG